MCRFAAYHGPPIPLDELLYKPDHSIVHQSTDAREREEPLNGDGWGVGWYDRDASPERRGTGAFYELRHVVFVCRRTSFRSGSITTG